MAWFEELYAAAEGRLDEVPWEDQRSQPLFTEWLDARVIKGVGKRALVIGCGLGDDAEELAKRGFEVAGFDLSATAISWAKRRFPDSSVKYFQADLRSLPEELAGSFDFICEVYTLQAMPQRLRPQAFEAIANCLAPGGELFVLCRGREDDDPVSDVPWPLSMAELGELNQGSLDLVGLDDLMDDEDPPVRRFRVVFQRR